MTSIQTKKYQMYKKKKQEHGTYNQKEKQSKDRGPEVTDDGE